MNAWRHSRATKGSVTRNARRSRRRANRDDGCQCGRATWRRHEKNVQTPHRSLHRRNTSR
ncbi:hypothetical protein GPA09_14330 [Burkholderia pseudomallei]|nr:hypothetical protein [Burkholderia pseudomallei]